jgi:formate dehydrogenase subunit gamma
MASERVVRFGATERWLHWVHAAAFFAMLGTGLVLYLPAFAQIIADRPLMKAAHLAFAALWLTALLLIVVLGDRRALARTRRELERFDDDDVAFLRRRPAPQGRFNGGQKAHAIVQAALAVLFVLSGTLLWLGERNTALRFSGTIALHDVAMFVSVILVFGHILLSTSQAHAGVMDGIVHGTVDRTYATRHHAKWAPEGAPPGPARRAALRGRGTPVLAAAAVVALLGLGGTGILVRSVLHAGHHGSSSVTSPAAVRAAHAVIARIDRHPKAH